MMVHPCKKPRCFQTGANKCSYPNPWTVFQSEMSGAPLTQNEKKLAYPDWKKNTVGLRDNNSRDENGTILCRYMKRNGLRRSSKTVGGSRSSRSTRGVLNSSRKNKLKDLKDSRKERRQARKNNAGNPVVPRPSRRSTTSSATTLENIRLAIRKIVDADTNDARKQKRKKAAENMRLVRKKAILNNAFKVLKDARKVRAEARKSPARNSPVANNQSDKTDKLEKVIEKVAEKSKKGEREGSR